MSACPPSEQLVAFLAGTLRPADRGAVEAHLEGCQDCQRTLDELTNAGLSQWRQLLAQPARTPAFATPETWPAPTTAAPLTWAAVGYDFLGELGRGGMGIVYKARQRSLNRLVALKVMSEATAAGTEERARFRREAEALALLPHPNIVHIHEVGEAGGQLFLALEYLGGGTLAARLQGTPQPARAAAELVETLARAMHFAHERGILHRDLKPANILLDESGRPKIADFGLVRLLAADGPTQTGDILGTPSYMAPEQASGQSAAFGPATDVWALGAILYECLTGRAPFLATQPLLTLQQVVHHEPAAPRQLNPGVPRDLETICRKCLEKEPQHRYPSAAALADDLGRYLRGEPIAARPAGIPERAIKWARRRPAIAGLLASLIVVTAVGFGLVIWQWRVAVHAEGVAVAATEREGDQRRLAERQLLETRTALYAARLDQAQNTWREGNESRAQELLAGCASDLRGWEWHYLDRIYRSGQVTFTGHADWVTGLAVSPDGQRVASASKDGALKVWDADTRATLLSSSNPAQSLCVAYHPDGKSLAVGRADGVVELRDAATLAVVRTWPTPQAVFGLAFAADGRLATCGEGAEVKVWDVTTGTAMLTCRGNFPRAFGVAFRRDGKQLAVASALGALQAWDAATGQPAFARRLEKGTVFGVAYSPDGRYLAGAGSAEQGVVQVWDAAGQPVRTFRDLPGLVWNVAFDPTGRSLAAADDRGTVKVWDTSAWRTQRTLPNAHTGKTQRLCFAPTGDRLFTSGSDATVKVWPLVERDLVVFDTRTATHQDRVRPTLAFHPDGARVAVAIGPDASFGPNNAGRARPVLVYGTARGNLLHSLAGHRHDVTALTFNADGSLLASADEGGHVKLWNPDTGREVLSFQPHDGAPCRSMAFRPGAAQFATAGVDETVRLWEFAGTPLTCRATETFRASAGQVQGVAFDAQGQRLAAASSTGAVTLWDRASGAARHTILAPATPTDLLPTTVALAPQSSELLAVAGGGRAGLYATGTGTLVASLPDDTLGPAFSPDGRRLVAADRADRRSVQVLDTVTGQVLLTLRFGKAVVVAVAFSPDGRRLGAADAHGNVALWDAGP